jgi:hypothetical protein
MGKKKHKVARYQVALNEPQNNMLSEMMKEDAQTDVSAFFGIILVNEYKIRQVEKNKKPVGRPKKEEEEDIEEVEPDFTDDLPKNKPYYGKMVGAKELKYLMDRSNFSIN